MTDGIKFVLDASDDLACSFNQTGTSPIDRVLLVKRPISLPMEQDGLISIVRLDPDNSVFEMRDGYGAIVVNGTDVKRVMISDETFLKFYRELIQELPKHTPVLVAACG